MKIEGFNFWKIKVFYPLKSFLPPFLADKNIHESIFLKMKIPNIEAGRGVKNFSGGKKLLISKYIFLQLSPEQKIKFISQMVARISSIELQACWGYGLEVLL